MSTHWRYHLLTAAAIITTPMAVFADNKPTRAEAIRALHKAAHFFYTQVAINGGYVWRYSSDLQHRQGEGLAYNQKIWVQPPGTPAVGLAFLDAYKATGELLHLKAASDAAQALVKGQLYSGGWHYHITFDPQDRKEFNYIQPPGKGKPKVQLNSDEPGGWLIWRQRRHKGNITIVDDDTTPSALRLLMQVDMALNFKDNNIHKAVEYGLASLLKAQHPIGAWSHNYDRFPGKSPDVKFYPVIRSSYPRSWSRTWTKKFTGCYVINDRITLNAIKTMLDAYEIYHKQQYMDSAARGGNFLLLSQMPEPQPAWAQQYDRHMHPVWDRQFEPPAITALESQDVLETLLLLYQRTGLKKFLDAVPRALVYLRRSQLDDGKLARFYELKTNKPLYFTRGYKITYDRSEMPTHYQFVVNSRLDAITLRYRRLAEGGPNAKGPEPNTDELTEQARHIIDSMDSRGAWLEQGWVRNRQGNKVVPQDGIIRSETFIENATTLSRFIALTE